MKMTLRQLAEHFGLNIRTLQHLHYRRTDGPNPVGKVRNKLPRGCNYSPVFDFKEYEAHLQNIGRIERKISANEVSFLEVQELLGIHANHLRYLIRTDHQFPEPMNKNAATITMKAWVFKSDEIESYVKHRRKYKDRRKVDAKPIGLTGLKKNDVISFLSSPSPVRQRMQSTGNGKTIRVSTGYEHV